MAANVPVSKSKFGGEFAASNANQDIYLPSKYFNFRLSEEQLFLLKEAFDIYDEDCDGILDSSVLGDVLCYVNEMPTNEAVKNLADSMDPPGRGKIDLSSFFVGMARYYRDQHQIVEFQFSLAQKASLEQMCSYIDPNNTGELEIESLGMILRDLPGDLKELSISDTMWPKLKQKLKSLGYVTKSSNEEDIVTRTNMIVGLELFFSEDLRFQLTTPEEERANLQRAANLVFNHAKAVPKGIFHQAVSTPGKGDFISDEDFNECTHDLPVDKDFNFLISKSIGFLQKNPITDVKIELKLIDKPLPASRRQSTKSGRPPISPKAS